VAAERIWIESTSEQEALCVLGALADYDARLRWVDGRYRVEVAVDRDAGELLRALHRAVQNCLDENGIEAVEFHVGQQAYNLRATA
jgi:hypothetical protein